jgi:hypothetical protein
MHCCQPYSVMIFTRVCFSCTSIVAQLCILAMGRRGLSVSWRFVTKMMCSKANCSYLHIEQIVLNFGFLHCHLLEFHITKVKLLFM